MTGEMIKVLERLHHRAAQRITGMTAKRGTGREWGYPSLVEAMEAADIHPIWAYIRRRQAKIAERVACRPIYELCMEADQMPGTIQLVRWWEQDVVNEHEE